MFQRNKDLLAIDLIVAASMLLPFFNVNIPVVRILFALPLVFIIPGYAFTEAFFVKNRLEVVERWVLILGVSLGLTMLAGFILNQTSWGLQYLSWAWLLGSLSFVFALIALARRLLSARTAGEQAVSLSRLQVEPMTVLFFIASAFIVIWTVSFAQLGAASSSSAFTQFWMLPASNQAISTPNPSAQATGTPTPSAQAVVLNIGVTSQEKRDTQYSVIVKEGNQVVKEWQGIALQPGQTWQEQFTYSAQPSQTGPVQAFLYKLDAPDQVYRTVTWWPSAG